MTEKIKIRSEKWYGWHPDLPDARDHKLETLETAVVALPSKFDSRPTGYPACYDQGSLGSCTGNGVAAAIDCDRLAQGLPLLTPSRLFIYYQERVVEGTVSQDSGAQIRDGIKVAAKYGAPPEKEWPYVISRFRRKPTAKVYANAARHLVTSYERVKTDVQSLRQCIFSGRGFVFGFSVFDSFESDETARTGDMSMPSRSEKLLGGHCVYGLAYDDAHQCPGATPGAVLCRNSWGTKWGTQDGHFWMPYQFVTNRGYASDFWVVRAAS